MSDDFNPQSNFKIIVLGIFLVVFALTAYFGYQFIVAAERSAADIPQPSFNKNSEFDFSKLDNQIPLPTHRQLPAERMASAYDLNSSGDDLQIKAGEFAYRNSQPVVRLALHNQGRFVVTAAAVNLSLFADDEKEPVASAVGIPIALSQPLLPDGDVVVSIPVLGDDWQGDGVRNASSRRILAQIISVSDGDHTEYSQTSQGVYLKQTGNDWSAPKDNVLPNNDFASTVSTTQAPPPDFADPTAGMDLSAPPPVQGVEIEPVRDFKWEQPPALENPFEHQKDTFRQPEALQPTQNILPEESNLPESNDILLNGQKEGSSGSGQQ